MLLAQWGVTILVNLVAKESPLDTRPDATVLVFTVGVAIVSGLLFGLVPALRASHVDLVTAMKEKARTGSRLWRFNLSSAMVVIAGRALDGPTHRRGIVRAQFAEPAT